MAGASGITDVGSALLAWVKVAGGLDDEHVFYGDQKVPPPDGPYCTLRETSRRTLGNWPRAADAAPVGAAWAQDTEYDVDDRVHTGALGNYYVCTAGGTSDTTGDGPVGQGTGITDGTVTWDYAGPVLDAESVAVGKVEVTHSLQLWGCSPVGPSAAPSILQRVRLGVMLPSVVEVLDAAGVVVFDVGDVRNMADLLGPSWEGRAQCDVRCYCTDEVGEKTVSIQRASGSGTGIGPPSPAFDTDNSG